MKPRIVVLLFGPPGAGKSTAARASGLIVYDRDDRKWESDRQFNDALASIGHDPEAQAVIIRSGATSSARARVAKKTGATHSFLFRVDEAELKRRVRDRGRGDLAHTIPAIHQWFERFDHLDGMPDFTGWEALPELDALTDLWEAS